MDLPGYGFAAGARKAKFKFNHAVDDYLKNRASLCCVFALLDSGLPPQEIDVEFVAWLTRNSVPFVLVFTKTDKVTPATVQANIAAFTARISGWFEKLPAIFTCSAMVKQGREELLGVIDETMTAIQAESGQAQPDAAIPPEDLATTDRKVNARTARKRRPISRALGEPSAGKITNQGVILSRTSVTLGKMKRIAVYCGSNKGTRAAYAEAAENLGRLLAREPHRKIGKIDAVLSQKARQRPRGGRFCNQRASSKLQ